MRLTYDTLSDGTRTRVKRRDFLRFTRAISVGLGGILLTHIPPAMSQSRELKLMVGSLFVSDADHEFSRQCKEFGKQMGIKMRVDRVEHLQISDLHARQIQAQEGHDITFMWVGEPYLYAKHLIELDDLVESVGNRAGGWINERIGRDEAGHYRAVPWYFVSFPIAVRRDLLSEIGEDLPDTWDDVYRIGIQLKARGHPTGIQIAHSLDSNAILRGIIWSWGGKEVEQDGKTIAINSAQTIAAYKFIKALYEDCMESEVLAWGDLNNNVCLSSGKCGLILNPISAYYLARKDNALIPGTERPVHQVIHHVLPPKGPAGRHMCGVCHALGIWDWTPLPEVAKAFIDFHFQKEQQEKFLAASGGYNQSFLEAISLNTIYAANPKLYFHPFIGQYTHALGWPGIPTAAAQAIWEKHIIPDTVAECVTGRSSAELAVKKAEALMIDEYKRWA